MRLEIEQETKDIGGKDPQLGPTWTERKLKTQVVVHDQQSVVIGGLIQERETSTTSPRCRCSATSRCSATCSSTRRKSKKKTNLLILLTPYIIKDQLDLQIDPRAQDARVRASSSSRSRTSTMPKYEPQIDYRRKRGLIEEINASLKGSRRTPSSSTRPASAST